MVDRLTLKVAATSALGIPRAAAATMRCRRSMEYALIFHSMPQPSMFLPAAVRTWPILNLLPFTKKRQLKWLQIVETRQAAGLTQSELAERLQR
jgi:hypothetical protein